MGRVFAVMRLTGAAARGLQIQLAAHRTKAWLASAALVACACLGSSATTAAARTPPPLPGAELEQRLQTFERELAADPENLKLAADYRKVTLEAGVFDRAIDALRSLAKRKTSGPNVQISLALAYADKVPTSGDIRRLYLGRDAMNALTQSIEQRPSVLAYYYRGQINLYYNRFIFHRTDKGVADLTQALSMVTNATPPALVAKVYTALGDGYSRLEQGPKAKQIWSEGLSRCPGDDGLRTRLEKDGQALLEVVTAALSAGRRSDTSLTGLLE